MQMRKELEIAIEAVKEAGKVSLENFGGRVAFELKSDKTPVTKIDKLCEKIILQGIEGNFPKDSVLSEESKEKKKDPRRRWIIDPIDGTKAFIHGIPTYGNMVAFEEDGEVVLGAINVPALKILFYAQKGEGAFANGEKIGVSNVSQLKEACILHGRGKGFLEKGYLKKLRKLLDSVYHSWGMSEPYAPYLVASGHVDAFVETFPHPWDVAAPKIIIEESGGSFSDLNGKNTIKSNNIAIYSNGLLHSELIKILKK